MLVNNLQFCKLKHCPLLCDIFRVLLKLILEVAKDQFIVYLILQALFHEAYF